MKYQFVDKIVSLEPGNSIHGQFTWPGTLEIFQDHFPEFPVVPGVLITEMMGQTAALCLQSARNEADAPILMQIKNATFRGWIKPDTCLDVYAEIKSCQKKLARAHVWTEVKETSVATAELLFTFELKDKLGLPETDPVLDNYFKQTR